MDGVHTTITGIKDDLEDDLPAILTAATLDDFDAYVVGYPTDQTQNQIAVWYERHSVNQTHDFNFCIQCQIGSGAKEETAYKYLDAIETYINTKLNQSVYGFTKLNYTCDMLSNFDSGQCTIFFDITFDEPLDDCD
jgi:hypothetical protein